MDDPIALKIKRLAAGGEYRPRVLDLFAGCGGLSLGFQTAGFEIVAAIEIDPIAAKTHAENFFVGSDPDTITRHAQLRDITKIEPEEIAEEFGLGSPQEAFDVIIGGPPCQAYARVGRAKLREIADNPRAFKVDPRGNLYLRYLHYVKRLKPLAILMENVPDILNFDGHNVVQEMAEVLENLGYEVGCSIINSAHHGVPQLRDRVFMIAYRKELGALVTFPNPTHHCELPPGYKGSRAVALKFVDLLCAKTYQNADMGEKHLPDVISAKQAIGDLSPITHHREGGQRRGTQRFETLVPYRQQRPTNYARMLRAWPGHANKQGVRDHVMRRLPRDTAIFEAMANGSEYPAALELANTMFEQKARQRGIMSNTQIWNDLRKEMVPPYDPGKFPNRWWKLEPDKPVRTLTAHIGKDTYTHIHYDGAQGRVISVREAARLQSFPDGFTFCGAMNAAYRQIGNSVPPLMAKSLANLIYDTMLKAVGQANSVAE